MDFYREMAEAPVDDVYLGEIACVKRSCLSPEVVSRIARELTRAGKDVYLSSPVLVTSEEERCVFETLSQSVGTIEINSPAFLSLARSRRAVAGAFLNVCNSAAARMLADLGVDRVAFPTELSREALRTVVKGCPLKTEAVVHGHIPLALSRRCHTARALMRTSRHCGQACREYPDGMVLEAGRHALFRVDGPLTLSASSYCLVEYLPSLERIGVTCVRIQPQTEHTARIISIYRSVLDRPSRTTMRQALDELTVLSSPGICNGWFLGKAGWIYESPN